MSGSEEGQARRNIVTVLVDGEEVELAEVEIGENAEVTVEEEMVVKDDDEDDDMGEVIMVDTIQQEVITTEQAQNAELELEYAAKEATPGKRLLLKDWLVQKLDSEEMPDILSWYNKSEGLFKIRWLHKATDSWEIAADGVLFRQWCIHTGKYDPANENPRKWKANFRCALNSLPDVIIVPSLCVRKGKEAYRVFKILAEKIPEKVREKQESSRKRRREKRESLLKAFAQNQAAMGNVEQAEALNAQIASNPSNIKIQLKRGSISAGGKKLKIVNVITEDGVRISKSDTPTSTATTSGGKTLLNGMDALCTAAAMMADTPGGEEGEEEEYDSSVLETITIETESDSPSTASKPTTVTATLKRKSGVNEGDVVTYYRPVGPIQVVNRDKQQAANATLLPPNVSSAVKSGIHTVTQLPTVIPGVTGLPVFRNINPVGRVQLAASNNVINTSSGNVVFSVRLAPGSMAADPRSTKINVIQDQTHQNVTMQQLANLQPVNIQQLNTSSNSGLSSQTSAYLIPKNLIQQQIAASAGNQPARVYTVKQNKNLSEMIVSSSAQLLDLQRSLQQTKPATSVATIVDTPQTSSGASTDARSAPALLDQLEYLNFKESVSALDFNKSQFQLSKHSDLIRVIRLYDSDKPSVEMSVSINRDYTFNVVIHNRNMSPNHELLKRHRKTIKNIQQFAQLLHRLSEYVTCIGNPEDMAHRQYTDYSSFISAFQEPDFGAKNSLLRYHSTIRSNTCHMLIKNPGDMDLPEADAKNLFRCEECKRIRTQVMSMRGLFSLIDGPKIPDNEQSRKKRLQLLKDFTTKEVLANRVDLLETQIKRYQKLLPSELPAVEEVTTDGTQSVTVTLTPSDTATVECGDQTIDNHNTDTTSELIASISDECTEGDVQNVIRVAFSDQADAGEPLTSRLADDAGAVYHIVDDGSNQDGVKLHTFPTESADAGTDIILVSTSGDGRLQSADGYLTQLTDSALGDNT